MSPPPPSPFLTAHQHLVAAHGGTAVAGQAGICAQRDRDMDRARGRGVDICSPGIDKTLEWMKKRGEARRKREEVGLGQGSRIIWTDDRDVLVSERKRDRREDWRKMKRPGVWWNMFNIHSWIKKLEIQLIKDAFIDKNRMEKFLPWWYWYTVARSKSPPPWSFGL